MSRFYTRANSPLSPGKVASGRENAASAPDRDGPSSTDSDPLPGALRRPATLHLQPLPLLARRRRDAASEALGELGRAVGLRRLGTRIASAGGG
jgi:hypothetical protein